MRLLGAPWDSPTRYHRALEYCELRQGDLVLPVLGKWFAIELLPNDATGTIEHLLKCTVREYPDRDAILRATPERDGLGLRCLDFDASAIASGRVVSKIGWRHEHEVVRVRNQTLAQTANKMPIRGKWTTWKHDLQFIHDRVELTQQSSEFTMIHQGRLTHIGQRQPPSLAVHHPPGNAARQRIPRASRNAADRAVPCARSVPQCLSAHARGKGCGGPLPACSSSNARAPSPRRRAHHLPPYTRGSTSSHSSLTLSQPSSGGVPPHSG